ncbi:MAG: tyrosine-type recombinase/integrase [Anaerolineaceae bacterium]|nr:tyrosine-type recombinase/integrase [Anaerolineaceae bacterium]
MLSEINQFVNWIRRRNPDARTWRDYSYDLNKFVILIGDMPIESITIQDIDHFISHQISKGFKPTTINRRLAAIISLFNFLSDEDPDIVCPVLPHRHSLREAQSLPRPVQPDKLKSFFSVINNHRDMAMFLLMLRCGLRISEIANLLLSDLYLEEKLPRLVARGKGLRERSVYLSPQAACQLRCYLVERTSSSSDHVFLSYQGNGMSTTAIHKRLMKYRSESGVHLTAHRLRHSFANDLLNADVPVTTIQKLMGHRWLETTQVYVQANDHQVKADFYAACAKLENWHIPEDGLAHLKPITPESIFFIGRS